MAVSEDYLEYIMEQMSLFGDFETKKMFGGVGFFKDATMFALIAKGIFRFRVDEDNKAEYEDQGMEPYRTKPNTKGMPYWQVPVDVLEDRDRMKEWADKAYIVALKYKKK